MENSEYHRNDQNEKSVLVLNYTMRCPLQCDFCCYGCTPERSEKMDYGLALTLISQAAEIAEFSSVAFTGGEALMYWEEVLSLSQFAYSKGLHCSIATSGFMGADQKLSRDVLGKLSKNGLKRLNISYDRAHEKFVPFSSVDEFSRIADSLGVIVYIVISDDWSRLESYKSTVKSLEDDTAVIVHYKQVAKVGRARRQKDNYDFRADPSGCLENGCYRPIHHDIVVFYDGAVYPCCSTFNRASPGLKIADANITPLADVMLLVEHTYWLRILKRRSFSHLFEMVKERDEKLYAKCIDIAQKSSGPCALCSATIGGKVLGQDIQKLALEYQLDLMLDAWQRRSN